LWKQTGRGELKYRKNNLEVNQKIEIPLPKTAFTNSEWCENQRINLQDTVWEKNGKMYQKNVHIGLK
jgi:hypothetical protein